jgi:hypothetical protein
MIALVSSAAVVAIVAASWVVARVRPVPVVLVACSDGTTRELPENDPRISSKI